MPQEKQPITRRPKVEDESTGNPSEHHGKHQPWDEALPGSGGSKGGLNRQAGAAREKISKKASPSKGRKQNQGRVPPGHA